MPAAGGAPTFEAFKLHSFISLHIYGSTLFFHHRCLHIETTTITIKTRKKLPTEAQLTSTTATMQTTTIIATKTPTTTTPATQVTGRLSHLHAIQRPTHYSNCASSS
jgi:hypothetical protein